LKYPYRRVLLPLAERMGRVDPDILSYAAVGVAAATGLCFYWAEAAPGLLLAAIGLTLLRMTLNTLDGVLAIRRGNLSLLGEIVNALPDRYSDAFYLLGIALSPLCDLRLGLVALTIVFLVSYSGMLGKAIGVEWQHHGPLGKVERLILVMVFSLAQYWVLVQGERTWTLAGFALTPLEWCMALYVALGQITVLNRVRGQVRQVVKLEWAKRRSDAQVRTGTSLVIYDSLTGNTGKVARAVAESLGAELRRAQDPAPLSLSERDLVVLATPNIRGKPSPAMAAFLREHASSLPRQYAVVVTYGMPVWNWLANRLCVRRVAREIGRSPVRTLCCKGVHAKYRTYGGHPDEEDLLDAYLFGVGLAKQARVRE
jgi:phosphatidylglycerophosphate synthase/menaquinone-dependent protoporphyrinogen IX oxidase